MFSNEKQKLHVRPSMGEKNMISFHLNIKGSRQL